MIWLSGNEGEESWDFRGRTVFGRNVSFIMDNPDFLLTQHCSTFIGIKRQHKVQNNISY